MILAGPLRAGAAPLSPANWLQADRVEIAMVGFTRESAEAFRTTKPAQTPAVQTPQATPAPRRAEAAAGRRGRAVVAAREHPKPAVVVRRRVNHWPRILRNRWAGPLERIHIWWNAHFDRRHFPYPDNPRKAA